MCVPAAIIPPLARAGELETVGPITLAQLLSRMADHDRGHVKEIETLVASMLIDASSGPPGACRSPG
ncbi:MAG: hypothetical protein ABIT01_14250 [Thermoanaerobaculia bacterium]